MSRKFGSNIDWRKSPRTQLGTLKRYCSITSGGLTCFSQYSLWMMKFKVQIYFNAKAILKYLHRFFTIYLLYIRNISIIFTSNWMHTFNSIILFNFAKHYSLANLTFNATRTQTNLDTIRTYLSWRMQNSQFAESLKVNFSFVYSQESLRLGEPVVVRL